MRARLEQQHTPTYSVEFFPPRTARGQENLETVAQALAPLKPDYFSVTFGAGGSTQTGTSDAVSRIKQLTGIDAAPHISCVGTDKTRVANLLQQYQSQGIRRIIALRGDRPSGNVALGDFCYACDLVRFIRETTGDHFHIEVAAYPEVHPQAASAGHDIQHFKQKLAAGANSAITQYFFNAEAYFRFTDLCVDEGIDVPIVPGIMPITQYFQLARFSNNCGAEIPRWLCKRLEAFADDTASLQAFACDVVTDLCAQLLDYGAPGLHFYCLNKLEPTQSIWRRLNLSAAGVSNG